MEYGILCFLPVIIVLITAILTRDTLISLGAGVVCGFILLGKGNPAQIYSHLIETLHVVLAEEFTITILVAICLFGAMIALVTRSGGVAGFSKFTEKFIKGRKSALICTWILGIIVFVDDYLNSLAVGTAMKAVTDRFKVSREMLCYIVNSTGSTVCAVLPISGWGIFMISQIASVDTGLDLTPYQTFVHSMPFIVYGWIATFIVVLFCLKIIPVYGPMKKVEQQTLETGVVHIEGAQEDAEIPVEHGKRRAINFLAPLFMLAGVTVMTGDMVMGAMLAIILEVAMYLPQKIIGLKEVWNTAINGMGDMFSMLLIIIFAYMLQAANAELGLTEWVIEHTESLLTPTIYPLVVFLLAGILSFATGTYWSLSTILFPLVVPLGLSLGVNVFLIIGSLISGCIVGAQICMYSDCVILASMSCGTTSAQYFRTSAPLVALPIVITGIIFVVLGVVM